MPKAEPATQLEVVYQEPKILLIAQDSGLGSLIADYLEQEQLEVVARLFPTPNLLREVIELIQQHDLYKVIVQIGFTQENQKLVELYQQLADFLDIQGIAQVFVVGITSKVDASSPLFKDWILQCQAEDELISYLYKNLYQRKIILAQDLVNQDDFLGQSLPFSLKFMIQAVANGYLIDPQQTVCLQTQEAFFAVIKKELVRPDKKNLIVRGSAIATKTICEQIRLIYQSFYQKSLNTIATNCVAITRLEKKQDLLEVVTGKLPKTFLDNLCRDLPQLNLAIDPNMISALLDQNQPAEITTTYYLDTDDDQASPALNQPADQRKAFANLASNVQPILSNNSSNNVNHHLNKENKTAPSVLDDSISQQLTELFTKNRTAQKTQRRSSKIKLIGKIKKKSKQKRIIFVGGVALCLIGIVFFGLLLTLNISNGRSQKTLVTNLETVLEGGTTDLKKVNSVELPATILGKILDIHLVDKSLLVGTLNKQLLDLNKEINSSEELSIEIFRHIFAQDQKQRASRIVELITQKDAVDKLIYEKASSLQAEANSVSAGFFDIDLQNALTKSQPKFKDLISRNQASQKFGSIFSNILGIDQKKVFYVLLQDDRELRPTGGFIQAVAMIFVEGGKVVDYQVFSASQIDDKIFGRLIAPAEVASFLGEENLYFRDANWDPDFGYTANNVSWFLKEALNQPTDGLIGINYSLVRDILTVTGDIAVDDHDGTINAWNLYNQLDLVLLEEKEQTTAGSFQVALLKGLFQAITKLSDEQVLQFNTVLYDSIKAQQTLVYLEDSSASNVIGQLGWSGAISQPVCPSGFGEGCAVDHFFQVESNIGVNKINPYINESVSHKIEIQDDQVVHQRQIKFSNKAKSTSWPLGSYKFYLRFYVNPESSLQTVMINGELVSEDKVLNYIDHNRKVFGIVAEVLPLEELELVFNYSTPHQISAGQSYFFLDQLQPGLKKRPTVISLKFSEKLEPKIISPQADVNQNQVVVTSDTNGGFIVISF